MKPAIEVRHLCKKYGARTVIEDLSFEVMPGETFALLGANGAGKTTTLECVEGLRRCSSGEVHVRGKRGIQLQSASLPDRIRPAEAAQLFARWNRVSKPERMAAQEQMGNLAGKQYSTLSTGQKRQVHLGLALIGRPEILFLDEPTAGLDVESRQRLHQQIRTLKASGTTILLSSHDMAEVEQLCDRILILSCGKGIFCGTQQELGQRIGHEYRVNIQTCEQKKVFQAPNMADALRIVEQFRSDNMEEIRELQISRGTLEELFLETMEGAPQ